MAFPGRIGKQCRERWHHHLNPQVIKRKWTAQEDMTIIELYLKLGTKWAQMAKHVPGRTDNQIKNRFNSNLMRRFKAENLADVLRQYKTTVRGD